MTKVNKNELDNVTLQQEAKYVEEEENARSIKVGEKSFIIDDW